MKKVILSAIVMIALIGSSNLMAQDVQKKCPKAKTECCDKAPECKEKKACCAANRKECTKKVECTKKKDCKARVCPLQK